MELERIMEICRNALENEGYEIYGYSETYEHFTVSVDGGEDVVVDFRED